MEQRNIIRIAISDLIESGFTQRDIAAETGISQPNVSAISLGIKGDKRGVGYYLGKKLERMHINKCDPKIKKKSKINWDLAI